MADENVAEKQPDTPAEKKAEKGKGGSLVGWAIIAVIVLVGAGTGFGLGRFFRGSKSQPAAAAEAAPAAAADQLKGDEPAASAGEDAWYLDLEPVVANLDEPGATRYVRAALTLEISPEMDAKKGAEFFEQKKPLLTNLLTIYLSGLNIEGTRGDKNLKRIQAELCDTFNERLFPDGRGKIRRILFKEFAIQ